MRCSARASACRHLIGWPLPAACGFARNSRDAGRPPIGHRAWRRTGGTDRCLSAGTGRPSGHCAHSICPDRRTCATRKRSAGQHPGLSWSNLGTLLQCTRSSAGSASLHRGPVGVPAPKRPSGPLSEDAFPDSHSATPDDRSFFRPSSRRTVETPFLAGTALGRVGRVAGRSRTAHSGELA